MAAAKKTPAKTAEETVTKKPSTEIANWDEELAKQAGESAKMEESTSTASFFSLKSGILSWNDSPLENNQMAVVITDSILENVTYDTDYDPDNMTPPICFAFGRDAESMVPHAVVFAHGTQVSDQCTGCAFNKYGSADKGKGKMCQNKRRLALIPAGKLDANGKFTQEKSEDAFMTAILGYLKLPVMSATNYSAYVKQLAGTVKRPPHGVFTKIKVVPDAKSQFRVTFELLGLVPNPLMGAVMGRHGESRASIEQPYNMDAEEAAPAKPIRGAKGKPAVKVAGRAKKF